MPPLDDDRWDQLVQAVLTSDDERDDPRHAMIDLRATVGAQRETEEPSGRRSSTSS